MTFRIALLLAGFSVWLVGSAPTSRPFAHSNLTGQDLRNADFRNADLTMAKLTAADLRGVNFTGAKLDRINLDRADLRGVIGFGQTDPGLGISAFDANFAGTDLTGWVAAGTYFERADFTNANLTRATLAGRFHDAKFDGAIVEDAILMGAGGIEALRDDLRRRGAIVDGAGFAETARNGRDFTGALLRHADLVGAEIPGVKLAGANLHSIQLDHARLDGGDLRRTAMYWASARNASFVSADLSEARINNVRAAEAKFTNTNLRGATFIQSDLSGADFRGADLTDADLSYANLTRADFTGAKLEGVRVKNAIIENVVGLDERTTRELRHNAARWRYDLREAVSGFLDDAGIPLHVALTAAGIAIALLALPSRDARFFKTIAIVNVALIAPLIASFAFLLAGGSPVAQMSPPGLWSMWMSLWFVLAVGLLLAGCSALLYTGQHIVRKVICKPRDKPAAAVTVSALTLLNCLLAIVVIVRFAPSA